MVSEIKDLKIQSYEEQIEISRAEIKYLQMQIRPHFFPECDLNDHQLNLSE
ncbi:hypothetical protein ACFSQ7_15160 [Paenibacillus rhizoplanae]